MRTIGLALVLLLLAGCTAAQREAMAIKSNNGAAGSQYEQCVLSLYNSPAAAPLRPHFPVRVTDASLAQMGDPSFANETERAALSAIYPSYQSCRRDAIFRLDQKTPALGEILDETGDIQDKLVLALAQRRLSWGRFVTLYKDLAIIYHRKMRIASGQITDRLNAENAEQQDRIFQALATAYAISASTPAASRLPAGAYRLPESTTTTTCHQAGVFLTCTQ